MNSTEGDLNKLTKQQLLVKCEELGITKCKSKNKDELIQLILKKKPNKNVNIEFIIEDEEANQDEETNQDEDTKQNEQIVTNNNPIIKNEIKSVSYSDLSIQLTKNIVTIEKKNNGIYFTPPETIHKNLSILDPYFKNIKNVLEPSCGSCEFIMRLNDKPDLNITGIEYNKYIYENIKHIEQDFPNIRLLNENYLNYTTEEKYDLIIGNPPYYVMSKDDVHQSYYEYFDGRPNIFILFIIKSLQLLTDNGILSFVLPKNFMNCLYYDKTRKYIYDNFKIISIIECNDKYLETAQETIILIIQKNGTLMSNDNNMYCLKNNNYTIFGLPDNINKLQKLYEGSTTLSQLGFKVNVGNIVWNQCKDELTNDSSKTLLIYSSDIKNNKLNIQIYKNKDKNNYIDREGETGPLLIINRGYGVGKYNFTYCLIDMEKSYLIENHLICIRHKNGEINTEELRTLYTKIIESFDKKKTKEFIKLYFGNNAINTTELCEILPIYDI